MGGVQVCVGGGVGSASVGLPGWVVCMCVGDGNASVRGVVLGALGGECQTSGMSTQGKGYVNLQSFQSAVLSICSPFNMQFIVM